MTEEEVQGHIDHLRLAMEYSPWPHDPRTAPLAQPTEEHLAQAMNAVWDAVPEADPMGTVTLLIPPVNVEAAKAMGMEVIEVPIPEGGVPTFRSLRERLDNPPTALALPPDRTPAEDEARDEASRVINAVNERFAMSQEIKDYVNAAMQDEREEFSDWLAREDLRDEK